MSINLIHIELIIIKVCKYLPYDDYHMSMTIEIIRNLVIYDNNMHTICLSTKCVVFGCQLHLKLIAIHHDFTVNNE